MNQSKMFQDLMLRVRAGEPQAAEELVRQYEPQIRRRIRVQMDEIASMNMVRSASGNMGSTHSISITASVMGYVPLRALTESFMREPCRRCS